MTIYESRPLPDGRAEVVCVVGTFDAPEAAELCAELANELERNPERAWCDARGLVALCRACGEQVEVVDVRSTPE